MAALPLAAASSPGSDVPPTSADVVSLPSVGLAQLARLLEDPTDPSRMLQASLAHQERSGQLPIGFTDTFARQDRPIDRDLHDAHLVCDLNADGRQDIILNNYGGISGSDSWITAESGLDGSSIWYRENLGYISLSGTSRQSETPPRLPPNMANVVDGNDDGVCDVLAWGFDGSTGAGVPITGPSLTFYTAYITLLDGKTGESIWTIMIESACGPVAVANNPTAGLTDQSACRVNVADPLVGMWSHNGYYNFPTGFFAYDTPSGPEFVFKTTDILAENVDSPLVAVPINYDDIRVTEHIFVYDAKTGSPRWQRDLNADRQGAYTNATFITGAANLAGDERFEVVLDQFFVHNPRTNDMSNPATGGPLAQTGRGMSMLTLRGEDGADHWSTLVFEEGRIRPNAPVEENYAVLVWTFGEIVGDVNGDMIPDPVAQYLTQEANMVTGPNGGFRTHIMPIDGGTGRVLWPNQDRMFQGWGFVRGLNVGPGTVTRLALGTIDLPTQTLAQGAFPPKDVRIIALDSGDGATVWEYREQFAQDSYLPYVLTLNQFRENLAPNDWDGDGMRDLLTPARYVPPGYEQLLLTTTVHDYQVLNATDGSVLHEIPAWGPNGVAMHCAGAEDELTILAGHGRRLDIARYNVTAIQGERDEASPTARTDALLWTQHLWMDPTLPRAASASFDLTYLAGRCDVDSEGRVFMFANTGLYSLQRGAETVPIRGYLHGNGTIDWQFPMVGTPAQILDFLELTEIARAPESDLPLAIVLATAPLIPGALIGGIALAVRARRGKALLGITMVLILCMSITAPALALSAPAMVSIGAPDATGPIEPTILPTDPSVIEQADADAPTSSEQVAAATSPPGAIPVNDPITRFSAAMAADPAMDAIDLARAMNAYYAELGLSGAEAEPIYEFPENDTITYSYNVGDINDDGTDDVAMDTYCVVTFCDPPYSIPSSNPVNDVEYFVYGFPCDTMHRLAVRSGADATELWNRTLNTAAAGWPLVCDQYYVIGTIHAGETEDLILYYYKTTDAWPLIGVTQHVEHTFSRVDGKTGDDKWRITFNGTQVNLNNFVGGTAVPILQSADSVLINPVLQTRSDFSVSLQPDDMMETLHLQGIGFEAVYATVPTLGLVAPFPDIPILEGYQAREWAARVDLETGELLWRVDTFAPDASRNIRPFTLGYGFAESYFSSPSYRAGHYWNPDVCCGDLTGDGVPDLVYRSFETPPSPTTNTQGPYEVETRIVLFDGATGERVYSTVLETDLTTPVDVSAQTLGDANGDGVADLLVKYWHMSPVFLHRIAVLNGQDGTEMWHYDSPRTTAVYVMGDANKDGGNDFAMVSWFNHTSIGPLVNGHYTNVTSTPIEMVSGRTGEVLWVRESIQAPVDIVQTYDLMTINGPPDVNGDGVGDLVIDDPLYLPDLTVIHRQHFVSGADGSTLFSYLATGGFAFPASAGDLTGDGRDEILLLSGDVVDLWLTLFDSENLTADWSRRVMAPRLSNYVFALPQLRAEPATIDGQERKDLFLNFHFTVGTRVQSGTLYSFCVGCDDSSYYSESVLSATVLSTYPRLSRINATSGLLPWSVPWIYDANLTRHVDGPTPASALYERATTAPKSLDAATVQLNMVTGSLIGTVSATTGALAAFFTGRRWIR